MPESFEVGQTVRIQRGGYTGTTGWIVELSSGLVTMGVGRLPIESMLRLPTNAIEPVSELSGPDAERAVLEAIFGHGENTDNDEPECAQEIHLEAPNRMSVIAGLRLAHLCKSVSAARFANTANESEISTGEPSTYFMHNGCGDSTAICWNAEHLVAVVFFHEDPRTGFNEPHGPDPTRLFAMLDPAAEPLARAALSRMPKHDIDGQPLLTAALWTDGQTLRSNDSWSDFHLHSGGLLNTHLSSPAVAMWAPYDGHHFLTDLDRDQALLCLTLLEAGPGRSLTEKERAVVLRGAAPEGETTARRLFAQAEVWL